MQDRRRYPPIYQVQTLLHANQLGKAMATVQGYKKAGTKSTSAAGRKRVAAGLRTGYVRII